MILNLVIVDYKRFISRPKTYKAYFIILIFIMFMAGQASAKVIFQGLMDAQDKSLFATPVALTLLGYNSTYSSVAINVILYSLSLVVSSFLIGDFIYEDYKTGFQHLILTKVTQKDYYLSKIIFMTSSVFLVWLSYFMIDFFIKSLGFPLHNIGEWRSMLLNYPQVEMYYFISNPYLTLLIDILVFCSFNAILSLLFIIFSMFKYKHYLFITLMPVFLYTILYNVAYSLGYSKLMGFYEIGRLESPLLEKLFILLCFICIEGAMIWMLLRKKGDCL